MRFFRFRVLLALAFAILIAAHAEAAPVKPHGRARIVVLMVWDGLRPDFVSPRDTPNLAALAREGALFERHHSIYPTLTMANAGALATGAAPAADGLIGNVMYFAPFMRSDPGQSSPDRALERPVSLENSKTLAALNARLDGHLVELKTVAQEIEHEGGYVAIVGKKGPTFIFDDEVSAESGAAGDGAHGHRLFATDDMAEPGSIAQEVTHSMESTPMGVGPPGRRDAYFARMVIEKALPEAKAAAQSGKPALVVFWQRDPDATQHLAGLGTAAAFEALRECDANLGNIRAAIRELGIQNTTDLIMVSDHGFATIRMKVMLSELLVGMGLKKSADSTDVVVARNGATDFIYLSPSEYASRAARHDKLQSIVNFAAAQEWCGPIFSREPVAERGKFYLGKPYLGWIDGTFSEAVVGLLNPQRSPDLIISFRELPDLDNSLLTGPANPAFTIGKDGQQSERNRSQILVRAVQGVTYADTEAHPGFDFTTGMGMHGAAGRRELHNFCAAAGPDFRMHLRDRVPTGNVDVAPTIEWLLGLKPDESAASSSARGRVLREALIGAGVAGASRATSISTSVELQGMVVKTVLHFVAAGGISYLDDATVERVKLGQSP